MPDLGISDYIRDAFKVPYNLILLSGGMLAGVVSLHPLVIWPLVAAAEIVYLLTMANSPRFQAVVRARRLRESKAASQEAADRLFATLNNARRIRFENVRNRCADLQRSMARTGGADQLGGILRSQQVQSVNQLLWVFLRTLGYEQALESFSRGMPTEEIERTIRRTEEALRMETLSEQMQTAYRENLEVLGKRLENLRRAEENLKTIEARLIRVENSIMLIQEQALTRQDPAFIEAEVNSATAGLTSVEQMLGSMDLPAINTSAGGPTPELLTLAGHLQKVGDR